MSHPNVDIRYVAHLARLELSSSESARFAAQLGDILGYMEQLKEVDVSQVQPMAHAVPLTNVVRPDAIRPSLPQADALRNAPAQANGLFVVPKIIE